MFRAGIVGCALLLAAVLAYLAALRIARPVESIAALARRDRKSVV